MSFLTPLFLLGGLAIAGPILFHLIRRNTRERFTFSSLMFLSPEPPKVTRKSRLEAGRGVRAGSSGHFIQTTAKFLPEFLLTEFGETIRIFGVRVARGCAPEKTFFVPSGA